MNWKHILMMLAGCTLPLLLIFIAPLLGIRGDLSTFIFIVAMMACHLLMPMHHGHTNHSKQDNHESHTH